MPARQTLKDFGSLLIEEMVFDRGPALPLTRLSQEARARKNDHARAKTVPPADFKSRGEKVKHTVKKDALKLS